MQLAAVNNYRQSIEGNHMSQELSQDAVVALNAIAEAFKPKKEKAEKAKFVLVVDGRVQATLVPSVKDIQDAARGIVLNALANGRKAPVITYGEVSETVEISVPVTTKEKAAPEAESVEEADHV